MSLTQVTVTGTVLNEDSTPSVGSYIQWSLTQGVVDDSTGNFISAAPVTAQTDANGDWSITVVATDDPSVEPQGQVYRVEIQVPSASDSEFRTISGTSNFLANSKERDCMTFEPLLAKSRIKS